MAKHDQRWRDARWKQKKRQRDAESKRREWKLSEFARQADEALEHMRQFSDWAEPMIERLDFLKEIGPGVNFAEILEGTPGKFLYQKWNEDGTYEIAYETDLYSDACQNRKIGTVKVTIYRVSYIAGRLEIHGRY